MINFISNVKHTPVNIYTMANVLKSSIRDNPHLRLKVQEDFKTWAYKIQALFE